MKQNQVVHAQAPEHGCSVGTSWTDAVRRRHAEVLSMCPLARVYKYLPDSSLSTSRRNMEERKPFQNSGTVAAAQPAHVPAQHAGMQALSGVLAQ